MLSINRDEYPRLSKLPMWAIKVLILIVSPLVLILALFSGSFIQNWDIIFRALFGKVVKIGGEK
jgi:antibiotic biosynthesis monooxygenase (ABM) superfamily enzyme